MRQSRQAGVRSASTRAVPPIQNVRQNTATDTVPPGPPAFQTGSQNRLPRDNRRRPIAGFPGYGFTSCDFYALYRLI